MNSRNRKGKSQQTPCTQAILTLKTPEDVL